MNTWLGKDILGHLLRVPTLVQMNNTAEIGSHPWFRTSVSKRNTDKQEQRN